MQAPGRSFGDQGIAGAEPQRLRAFDTNRSWSFLARETQLYSLRNKRFCRLWYLSPVIFASHCNLNLTLIVVDDIARK